MHWAKYCHRAGIGLFLGETEITISPVMSKLQNNWERSHKQTKMGLTRVPKSEARASAWKESVVPPTQDPYHIGHECNPQVKALGMLPGKVLSGR